MPRARNAIRLENVYLNYLKVKGIVQSLECLIDRYWAICFSNRRDAYPVNQAGNKRQSFSMHFKGLSCIAQGTILTAT